MNKIAYTGFVAFVSAILTLVVVFLLSGDSNSLPHQSAAPTGSTSLPVGSGETAPNQERIVTPEELARHSMSDDCWIAIRGKVYNITSYIPLHPTPPSLVQKWCGQNATEAWDTKGLGRPHSQVAQSRLVEHLVGILAE